MQLNTKAQQNQNNCTSCSIHWNVTVFLSEIFCSSYKVEISDIFITRSLAAIIHLKDII